MSDTFSEHVFRTVVEEAPDAILLVDHQGRVVFVNAQVETLFGYVGAELVGQRIEFLIPEPRRSMHVIHREIYQERPTRRAMGIGLELSGRRRDGSTFPVEISLSSFEDSGVMLSMAVVRDVTRQRRAEEALRRSEERHRLLNERSENIVFRYRLLPAPGFEYVSSSVARALGFAPEAFYADERFIESLTHEADRKALHALLTPATIREAALRLRTSDGEERWLEWSVAAIADAEGVVVALEGTARDVTERREVEGERARLESEVQMQADRQRIAGDLHDDTIQSIYALGLGLHAARDDQAISKEAVIDRTVASLGEVIATLRNYMEELSGADHDRAQAGTLQERLAALIDEHAMPKWSVRVDPDLGLPGVLDRQLFLLAKELVSNVQRHARAEHASLHISRAESGLIQIAVADDGVGFDPSTVAPGTFGLRSIELRTAAIGGEVRFERVDPRGMRVRVTFAVPRPSVE